MNAGQLLAEACKELGMENVFARAPQPGDGANFVHFAEAANGHIYGYNSTPDKFGKWYAVDYRPTGDGSRSGKGKAANWKLDRLVKCATRIKARTKATTWYHAAGAKSSRRAERAAQ